MGFWPCALCGGSGYRFHWKLRLKLLFFGYYSKCPHCNGRGKEPPPLENKWDKPPALPPPPPKHH